MSAHDMADSQSAEMQLIVINAPHSIRSDSAATANASASASASGSGIDSSPHADDSYDSEAQRCFAHWWTVAAHALYLALVAAVGWHVSFRTMAIIVSVLTAFPVAVSAAAAITARAGKWTRAQQIAVALMPLPIVVCLAGLGMATWTAVNAQYCSPVAMSAWNASVAPDAMAVRPPSIAPRRGLVFAVTFGGAVARNDCPCTSKSGCSTPVATRVWVQPLFDASSLLNATDASTWLVAVRSSKDGSFIDDAAVFPAALPSALARATTGCDALTATYMGAVRAAMLARNATASAAAVAFASASNADALLLLRADDLWPLVFAPALTFTWIAVGMLGVLAVWVLILACTVFRTHR